MNRAFALFAFEGIGASLEGGRWNRKGTPLVYCAGTIALAALEVRVHLGPNPAMEEYVLVEGRIPADAAGDEIRLLDLPAAWDSNLGVTQSAGERWLSKATSAILVVPSVLTAHESASIGDKNILLNPRHPEFANLRIADQRPFRFDSRLFTPQT